MQKVTNKVKKKLTKFVEAKKEQAIINIENSTFFGILLKGIITHWVSIVIFIILVGIAINYHLENVALKELALQEEIKVLEDQLESNKQINEDLKKRIKELSILKVQNAKKIKLYRDKLKTFNSEQLKQELLNHLNRLKKKSEL